MGLSGDQKQAGPPPPPAPTPPPAPVWRVNAFQSLVMDGPGTVAARGGVSTGLMDRSEVRAEVQSRKDLMIAEAKSWNKTSPDFSETNGCGIQAGNLAYHLNKMGIPEWSARAVGGTSVVGIPHQAVQVHPEGSALGFKFKSFILDPYKGPLGYNAKGGVRVYSPAVFRFFFPFPHYRNDLYPNENWRW